jgi:hypothetical protein
VGPEPVWTIWRSENSRLYRYSSSDLSVVQPVASRYTDCAIAALSQFISSLQISFTDHPGKFTSHPPLIIGSPL